MVFNAFMLTDVEEQQITTKELIFHVAQFPLLFWGEYIQYPLVTNSLKGWWHFLSVNRECGAINNKNNGITMNSYFAMIFTQIFHCNIPRATPYLSSNLQKIRNTKYTSIIHILTSLIHMCKTSHILNTTQQLLLLKTHDLASETLSSTLNSFVAGHS